MRSKTVLLYGALPAGLIALGSRCLNAQDCVLGSAVPCVVQWYNLFTVGGRPESFGRAAALLTSGDALAPGVSKNATYTDRNVLRYRVDGTPVFGFGIASVPWFIAPNPGSDFYDFGIQKVVLDEARDRFFILFSAERIPLTGAHDYYLAGHSLSTGERLLAWGGTRAVGYSFDSRVAFDIDGNGDVWTVVESQGDFRVKKWQGADGLNVSPTNITPPADYTLISSPAGQPRRLQAFGVRKSDNKMFLAFGEGVNDAVVTLWSPTLQFLKRLDYINEITAPPSVPPVGDCCGTAGVTDHPYYSDGFVDAQGNLTLAGTYRFRRFVGEFETYVTFPTVLRFGVDAVR